MRLTKIRKIAVKTMENGLVSREAGVLWLLRDSYIHDVYMSGSEIGRDHMILHQLTQSKILSV
jgi:hypothetical protein